MAIEDLETRFRHHPPTSDEIGRGHDLVRAETLALATLFDRVLVDGREKSLAITKLEEAMFWANGSIARNQKVALGGEEEGVAMP